WRGRLTRPAAPPVCAPTALRLRARTRVNRPPPGLQSPANPEHDDVRLRVGRNPAQPQLPDRHTRVGPGRYTGGAPRAVRGETAQARPVPGAEGGVLPGRLPARPGRARR